MVLLAACRFLERLLLADRTEMVERVVQAPRAPLSRGESRVRLLLHPPQLGGLRIDLAVKDGVLDASLRAETHAARHVLVSNLDALRDALSQQGIAVGRFEVSVRDDAPRDGDSRRFTDGPPPDEVRAIESEVEDMAALRRRLSLGLHRVDLTV